MKLSIITVCYNSEKVIEKTILSILNQTMPVYEYIIVDGNSQDGTMKIVKLYEKSFMDKGIPYRWISEPDKGISDAFNKGINIATGDLIGIINSDDELKPDTCKILSRIPFDSYDIVYGNCEWMDEKNKISTVKKPKHNLKKLLYYMILYHPSTFVKRSVYDCCGTYDVSYRYCMDKHFLYRCYLKEQRFIYIDETLTIFKSGGVSDNNAKSVFIEGSRMALEFDEPYIKVKLIEHYKLYREIIVRFIKSIWLLIHLSKGE